MEIKTYNTILTQLKENELENLSEIGRTKLYFHYTKASSLKSIITNKTLRFCALDYMNDSDEVLDFAKIFLSQMDGDTFYLDQITNERKYFFSFSLCQAADDVLLWRNYSIENNVFGYSIEFNLCDLVRSLIKLNFDILHGCELFYGKVLYNLPKKKRISKHIYNQLYQGVDDFCNKIVQKLLGEKVKKEISDSPFEIQCAPSFFTYYENDIEKKFSSEELLPIFVFAKNYTFRSEKEIRICFFVPANRYEELTTSGIIQKNNEKVWIDLKFDLNSIIKIVQGPGNNEESVYEYGIPLVKSCCSIRSL